MAVTVFQQSAFNAGALQASVPIMLRSEPFVAVVIGFLVLDEQLAAHGIAAPILLAMVGAMTAATIVLGRGSGGHHDRLSSDSSADRRAVGATT